MADGSPSSPEHARLATKLRTLGPISSEEEAALHQLPLRFRSYGADQVIVREGDRPDVCGLIVEGFVQRYRDLPGGARQIMSFHIPGDMPDVHCLHLPLMDHSLGAVAPTRMAFVPHEAMNQLLRTYPNLAHLFWRDTLVDAAVFREWIVNLGRRPAYMRIAHLLCELIVRFRSVGLGDEAGCDLPLTQAELGDAVGLSTVHVNRVLQELRRDGLIEWRGRRLNVPDWPALKTAAEFDPAYLHLAGPARDAA